MRFVDTHSRKFLIIHVELLFLREIFSHLDKNSKSLKGEKIHDVCGPYIIEILLPLKLKL